MALSEDDKADQYHGLDWKGGVPVSRRFNDPYYSLNDGWAETEHVFLAGNDLPRRFCPGFHVAELGFGTGLNALVALSAWRRAGISGPLTFTSFEAYPLDPDEITGALAQIPKARELRDALIARLGGDQEALPDLNLNVVLGDARQQLPVWDGLANAWFLDGFSPAKNPELWEDVLLATVGAKTAPDGTAATYTAAGHVRRALASAGFEVSRTPGFLHKRHMTRARKR